MIAKEQAIGTMVWCLSCEKVVWAYDSDYGDVRGILNMMNMSCRLCNCHGNFDGQRIYVEYLKYYGDAYDGWSAMRFIAKLRNLEWQPSSDNKW